MAEFKLGNPHLRGLLALIQPRWRSIAERSAILFLFGGGLMSVTAILFAIEALTALSTQGPLTGVTSFTGIIITYVGLLALYPWYAARRPRLARASLMLVMLPTIVVAVLLIWGVAHHLPIGAVPSPIGLAPVGLILMLTFLLFSIGVGLFGVASLQTMVPSRRVGFLLLALATIWIGLLLVSSVYGSKLPVWLDFITVGLMAICSMGIGRALRTGPSLDEYSEHALDPSA